MWWAHLISNADVFFFFARYSLPRVRVNQEVVDFVSHIRSQDFHSKFVTAIEITWCFSYKNAVVATFLFIIIITSMCHIYLCHKVTETVFLRMTEQSVWSPHVRSNRVSGIQEIFACGIRNTAQETRNPSNVWNLGPNFHWLWESGMQYLVIRILRSGI